MPAKTWSQATWPGRTRHYARMKVFHGKDTKLHSLSTELGQKRHSTQVCQIHKQSSDITFMLTTLESLHETIERGRWLLKTSKNSHFTGIHQQLHSYKEKIYQWIRLTWAPSPIFVFLKPTGILCNNPYFPILSHTLKCSYISHTDTCALFTVDNTISVCFYLSPCWYQLLWNLLNPQSILLFLKCTLVPPTQSQQEPWEVANG